MGELETNEIIENSENEEKKSWLNILKYLPLVYPILVFLGYLNYDFYYRKFDIDIFNYLTINEFLFSFISLAYPVIFLLVFYTAYSVYGELLNKANLSKNIGKIEDNTEKKEQDFKLKKSIFLNSFNKGNTEWKKSNYPKAVGNYLLSFLLLILYIITYLVPYAILWYGYTLIISPLFSVVNFKFSSIENLGYLDNPKMLLTAITLWYVSFGVFLGIKYMSGDLTRKSARFYLFAALICTIISTLIRYQNIRVHDFLFQEVSKQVNFDYEDINVKSDKKKRLLGITADYIFLRNIETHTNYIYNMNNVRNLEISSILNNDK